jgi:hypothetical protein
MKTINEAISNSQFSKLTRAISSILGIKPMAFKIVPIKMFRITSYMCPLLSKNVNLKEYFIDQDGDLYSRNTATYFTKYGKELEKLSNNCKNSKGDYINSLRTIQGSKVTVRRSVLINLMKLGRFEDVTESKVQAILQVA